MGLKHEYRVCMKIRNNLFIQRIEKAGYKTIGEFCRIHNLNTTDVGEVIALKRSPLMSNGKFRVSVIKAADILECAPEDLFTQAQMAIAIKTNKQTILVNEAELKFMLDQPEQKLLDVAIEDEQRNGLIEEMLAWMPPREAKILRLRFGLDDGIEHTLDEISKDIGCSRNRVRQIECRALRRLRQPGRADQLRDFIN